MKRRFNFTNYENVSNAIERFLGHSLEGCKNSYLQKCMDIISCYNDVGTACVKFTALQRCLKNKMRAKFASKYTVNFTKNIKVILI